jgi:hypothetical protein
VLVEDFEKLLVGKAFDMLNLDLLDFVIIVQKTVQGKIISFKNVRGSKKCSR